MRLAAAPSSLGFSTVLPCDAQDSGADEVPSRAALRACGSSGGGTASFSELRWDDGGLCTPASISYRNERAGSWLLQTTKRRHVWRVRLARDCRQKPDELQVEVVHNRVNGRKRVLLDGREVYATKRRFLSWSFEHTDSRTFLHLGSAIGGGFHLHCQHAAGDAPHGRCFTGEQTCDLWRASVASDRFPDPCATSPTRHADFMDGPASPSLSSSLCSARPLHSDTTQVVAWGALHSVDRRDMAHAVHGFEDGGDRRPITVMEACCVGAGLGPSSSVDASAAREVQAGAAVSWIDSAVLGAPVGSSDVVQLGFRFAPVGTDASPKDDGLVSPSVLSPPPLSRTPVHDKCTMCSSQCSTHAPRSIDRDRLSEPSHLASVTATDEVRVELEHALLLGELAERDAMVELLERKLSLALEIRKPTTDRRQHSSSPGVQSLSAFTESPLSARTSPPVEQLLEALSSEPLAVVELQPACIPHAATPGAHSSDSFAESLLSARTTPPVEQLLEALSSEPLAFVELQPAYSVHACSQGALSSDAFTESPSSARSAPPVKQLLEALSSEPLVGGDLQPVGDEFCQGAHRRAKSPVASFDVALEHVPLALQSSASRAALGVTCSVTQKLSGGSDAEPEADLPGSLPVESGGSLRASSGRRCSAAGHCAIEVSVEVVKRAELCAVQKIPTVLPPPSPLRTSNVPVTPGALQPSTWQMRPPPSPWISNLQPPTPRHESVLSPAATPPPPCQLHACGATVAQGDHQPSAWQVRPLPSPWAPNSQPPTPRQDSVPTPDARPCLAQVPLAPQRYARQLDFRVAPTAYSGSGTPQIYARPGISQLVTHGQVGALNRNFGSAPRMHGFASGQQQWPLDLRAANAAAMPKLSVVRPVSLAPRHF